MAQLAACDDCNDKTIENVSRVCQALGAKVRAMGITACGTSFNGCLSDTYRLEDLNSRELNYPATYADGTVHPNAGSPNPTRDTLTILGQIQGDMYVPGDTETTDLDYSCGPSVYNGDTTFEITIRRLYQKSDEQFYRKLAAGNYGEVALVDEEGLGYIIENPTIRTVRSQDGSVHVIDFVISWKETSSLIEVDAVADPLFIECD